jgi:hypothetical protein
VQNNSFYEINMLVRNQTKELKKIRIIHPTSSFFNLKYDETQKQIAPGTSFIYFRTFFKNFCHFFFK